MPSRSASELVPLNSTDSPATVVDFFTAWHHFHEANILQDPGGYKWITLCLTALMQLDDLSNYDQSEELTQAFLTSLTSNEPEAESLKVAKFVKQSEVARFLRTLYYELYREKDERPTAVYWISMCWLSLVMQQSQGKLDFKLLDQSFKKTAKRVFGVTSRKKPQHRRLAKASEYRNRQLAILKEMRPLTDPLEVNGMTATYQGQSVILTRGQLALLQKVCSTPGSRVDYQNLTSAIRKDSRARESTDPHNSVRLHLTSLRKKLRSLGIDNIEYIIRTDRKAIIYQSELLKILFLDQAQSE